jgi:hypothetical protein
MRVILIVCTALFLPLPCKAAPGQKAPVLYAGWATTDITPDKPVALIGQLHKRISQSVRDPLTATALALEMRAEDGRCEQAMLVSCDLLYIRRPVQDRLRQALKAQLPDLDVEKLFLNATHTHTGPGFADEDFGSLYDVSNDEGVTKASEYADFFVDRVAKLAVNAWRNRRPSGMSWALGHAVVGMNRRAHYFDGSTVMYGATNRPDFANTEGYEDHGVEILFFWDQDKAPVGIVINIACTAQETEGLSEISADFWHDVRVEVRRRFSREIFVLAQCAAAGDVSPHLLYRARAEEIMRQRRGLSSRQEIARRIVDAVESTMPLAKQDIQTSLVFKHAVAKVSLPARDAAVTPFYTTDSIDPIEFHVLRLGDIAIATNPFELYLDYGVRIKARSPAILTFLVQLSCGHSGYLPTEKAVKGGGYSADKYVVGPKGGQVLVDETVKQLSALWN